MKQFKIYDWAGNDKTNYYRSFETFEDAWERLYKAFDYLDEDAFDELVGEFEVIEVPYE